MSEKYVLEKSFSITEEESDAIKRELISSVNFDLGSAGVRQRSIAIDNSKTPLAAVDGIGEKVMSIDAQIFHFWNLKMPGCWRDPDFRDWFKRNFPETVVKCKGSNKTFVFMPSKK